MSNRLRISTLFSRSRIGGVAYAALLAPFCFASAPAKAETIGLVMSGFHVGGPFTNDSKQECPLGFTPTNEDNFKAQYPTKEEQDAVIKKYGTIQWHYRGPQGESDVYNPELVDDPLPYRDGLGNKGGEGFNLDGTQDGRATDKTCAHEKFITASGEAVDNQLFRVFACVKAVRPQGFFDGFSNTEIQALVANRWLLEISGVDSRENDDEVKVTLSHGLDELVADGNGGFVAGRSQRVNEEAASWIQHTTGRIKDGVLITDPMPQLRLTATGVVELGEHRFIDGRFKLKLTPTGATGVLAGYRDIPRLYRFYAKTLGLHGVAGTTSMPGVYRAMLRHADGHKDPATGQCTSISSVYAIDFVNANIVRSSAVAEVTEAISKGAASSQP